MITSELYSACFMHVHVCRIIQTVKFIYIYISKKISVEAWVEGVSAN